MARYVFRLSVLGPRALTPTEIASTIDPVLRRYGFTAEPVQITQIKGLEAPVLRMGEDLVATYRVVIPGQAEYDTGIGVASPEAPAARAIRTLTQASVVIEGTLPADTTSPSGTTRAGSGVFSSAVFTAVNSTLGPGGFFNLSGSGRAAGLAPSGGGGGSALAILGLAATAMIMYSRPTTSRGTKLFGLGSTPRSYRAQRMRKLAQRYRHAGRYIAAKKLERKANQISR